MHSYSRSQETGVIRLLQPLSRAKEERMRVVRFLILLVSISSCVSGAAFAADLKVKVVDPQGAAVAGAQVSLVCMADVDFVHVLRNTAADGTVALTTKSDLRGCRIQVLAPGFSAATVQLEKETELSVNLRLATASETVVVTATRTPVAGEASGSDVDVLSRAQLTTMQPIAADDAIRFLPGAVVNTAGQRGGFSSLFVRGGESTYNKVIVD